MNERERDGRWQMLEINMKKTQRLRNEIGQTPIFFFFQLKIVQKLLMGSFLQFDLISAFD